MTKPTTGRSVHLVVRDCDGRFKHRAAVVCEPLPTGDGYDCSIHAFLLYGDTLPQGIEPSGGLSYVDVARRGVPGAEPDAALLGTWHWPEGSPDARDPALPKRKPARV